MKWKKFLSLLRIETIFIHMSGCQIFLSKKNEKIVIYIILIIMVLLCQSRFPHLAKVPTPCFLWVKVSTLCQGFYTLFLMSQGFHTLPRLPHLVSMWVKVPTHCQGSHTLFLCESRFPHLAKVPTPCFYVSQGFHTLFRYKSRFPHLAKVSKPYFYICKFHIRTFFIKWLQTILVSRPSARQWSSLGSLFYF